MRKAFSLSISLFISAVLLAFSIYFLSVSKTNVSNALKLNKKLFLFLQTKSYLEKVKFYIGSGEFKNFYVINKVSGLPNRLRLDGTKVEINNTIIKLQDTGGLLNVLYPNFTFLKNFLEENNTDVMIDSFRDWLDWDEYVRINGAESFYYKSIGAKYVPRNKNFIAFKDELIDIRGWKNYDKYEKFFVFVPRSGYNFLTMPDSLLMAKYKLSKTQIEKIHKLKNRYETYKAINYWGLHAKDIDVDSDMYFSSKIVKIYIKSEEENISTSLDEVVDFKFFKVLYIN